MLPIRFSSKVDLVSRYMMWMVVTSLLMSCGLLLSLPVPVDAYEGFGTSTQGAKSSPLGWTTYAVTSLDDEGPGTLRDAITNRRCGPDQHICRAKDKDPANQVWGRKIVFAPGLTGDITLQSDIIIQRPYLTIDGASADSPGITIRKLTSKDGEVKIHTGFQPWQLAHHIIITHLRFIGNWDQVRDSTRNNNATLLISGRARGAKHIIIDHCTFRNASDGTPDLWGYVENVTLSWNLFYNALHPTTISGVNGKELRKNISLHHNVYAYTHQRNPQIKLNVNTLEYINNIVFNWGLRGRAGFKKFKWAGYGVRIVDHKGAAPTGLNFINNVFKSDRDQEYAIYCDSNGADGRELYLAGNIVPKQNDLQCDSKNLRKEPWPIPPEFQVLAYPAHELGVRMLPDVGMQYRDQKESDLIYEILRALKG